MNKTYFLQQEKEVRLKCKFRTVDAETFGRTLATEHANRSTFWGQNAFLSTLKQFGCTELALCFDKLISEPSR